MIHTAISSKYTIKLLNSQLPTLTEITRYYAIFLHSIYELKAHTLISNIYIRSYIEVILSKRGKKRHEQPSFVQKVII